MPVIEEEEEEKKEETKTPTTRTTITEATPINSPTFEMCLFPRHRRSLTMTHIEFEQFICLSTPQKTCSLNIPL